MMGKRVIRQIEELKAGQRYAVVFNERLSAADVTQLKAVCEKANIQVLILTNARVVPVNKLAAVIGEYADPVKVELASVANA